MAITFKIGTPEAQEDTSKPIQGSVTLNARKTLDGNILIYDHDDIDIALMPSEKKVIAFTKDNFSDLVYDTQNRLFKYLTKKGIIIPETVKSGNVYGSLEGRFPEEDKYANGLQVAILNIAEFLDMEKPYMESINWTGEMEEDMYLDPDAEDSTELGEVPHEEKKGTVAPGYPGYYYGLASVYRY